MARPNTEIILDSIADGVFTVDRERNITSFNRAAEEITGVSREQALGQKCFDVFRTDVCQSNCALAETMASGSELVNLRVNILNHEGRRVPISISAAALRDEQGEIVGGVETFRDLSDIELLREELRDKYTFANIISRNHEIQQLIDILPDIAASGSTALIEGPSGSGKELFAHAIHDLSDRQAGRLVPVNCGALPDTLLESELFGYVKGAFTDAKKDKPGRFAWAEDGTLFLDEIGDISVALQVKLLRVLQEKEYEPLGASAPVKTNARIIVATNKNLSELVARGAFREDLYYRLNVVRLTLPPLARRREDIPLLVGHFIKKFNARQDRELEDISQEALAVLAQHSFPGNVRELENIIEYAFILCRGAVIETEHLPGELLESISAAGSNRSDAAVLEQPLAGAEARAILETLRKHGGNQRKTAAELGVHRTTLWRKMKKYGLAGRID
ncbi:sigma-54 interaction domain-containing protein [Candidatus Sumerlaeota bacterium]